MEKIMIDHGAKGSFICPELFAHNLEHTRSSIFRGLSAEILRNRKFAGKPACCSGEAAEWYRIGTDEVYLTLDPVDCYVRHVRPRPENRNEMNSQVIQNPVAGTAAGIGQREVFLEGGKRYTALAVLKGRGDSAVSAVIRITGQAGKTYAQQYFQLTCGNWEKCFFTFTMPATDTCAHFEIFTADRCEVKVGAASLMPENNFHGMRPDVVALLKEIGASVLRWPGGNFAGEYHWKDGLLERDIRAAQMSYRTVETHPHTHGFDFHEIAVDDFVALCREIGAQPYITINLAWDSPKEAAQFVEYCNGSETTEWGQKRAKRGNPEPYGVKYWSLGNEFGLGHMEGPNTPRAYSEKALLCAEQMKKVDPGLILFASGAYSPEHDSALWAAESLPMLAGKIDYISYHSYLPRVFQNGMDFVTDRGLRESYNRIVAAPKLTLEDLWKLRAMMDAKGEDAEKTAISFDEWNLFFAWYHKPCVIEGIYTALMLEMFIRHYEEINMPMAMYFEPVNEGAILVYPFTSELSANGQVFGLMKNHIGGTLIPAQSEDKELHCIASSHGERGILTLINASYDREIWFCLPEDVKVTDVKLLLSNSILHGSRFEAVSLPAGQVPQNIEPHSVMQIEYANL